MASITIRNLSAESKERLRRRAAHSGRLVENRSGLAELRYGIARLADGRRKTSLTRFWNMTRERFVGRIFSFDDRAAEVYGDIVAAAQRAGTPINVADGLIAAPALVHGMSIATRDVGDFHAAGAPLVNPWDFTMPLRS